MSAWRLARGLLLLLAVALILAGIGLLVSRSRPAGRQAGATAAVDNYGCLTCHADPGYQPETSSRPWSEFQVDEAVLVSSTHGSIDCASCHVSFATGQPIDEPAIQELCGRCHAHERSLQEASVHADPEVATCLDCHSPAGSGHDIPPVLSTSSPVFASNVADTCGSCHADERLMARYGLDAHVHDTYLDSPHGKVLKLTGSDVDGLYPATCTTCHGSHDVRETDDPASPVRSTASLAGLCATCHRGANENFARTLALHEEFPSEELSPPAFYGERFFFLLTAGVVGLGLLMVSLEGVAWLTGRATGNHNPGSGNPDGHNPGGNPGSNPGHNPGGNPGGHGPASGAAAVVRIESAGAAPAPPAARVQPRAEAPPARRLAPPEEVVRFDIHQRLQHFLMMASFLVLAFTGLPQKFPDWEVSQWLIGMWGGLDSARTIHRFAGLVMIVDCLYHLGYIAYGAAVLKKPLPIWMIPTPKDLADFFQDLQCWFGRSSERPKFGRFSYREKFDYWAIFWGMPVMAISGLILMFPVLVSKFLPSDAVPVALVAHSDEAVLAVLWIFIVHMFFVHLNPRFFPLNRAIFTGKMPRHLQLEEHPLEPIHFEAAPIPTRAPRHMPPTSRR